jgi:hypothetical protein
MHVAHIPGSVLSTVGPEQTFISGFSAEERNVLKTRHHEHKDALEQMGKILKGLSYFFLPHLSSLLGKSRC